MRFMEGFRKEMSNGLVGAIISFVLIVAIGFFVFWLTSKPIVEKSATTGQPVRALNGQGEEIPLQPVLESGRYDMYWIE